MSLLIAVLLPQLLLPLQDMLDVVFFFFKHQADFSSTGIDLHASVQTLLLLLSLLLLLPLFFLLSFLIVVLLLELLSTHTVVNQFDHLRRVFFLISSLFSPLACLVASRPVKVRTLLQHSCAIDGGPHCLVLRRHSDPHPDVFFLIEMLPHLVSANPVAVQLLLPCLRCCCLICTSCLL